MDQRQEPALGTYLVMVLDEERKIAAELSKSSSFRVDWQYEYGDAVKSLCCKPYDLLLLGRQPPQMGQILPACVQKQLETQQLPVIWLAADRYTGLLPPPWEGVPLQGVWPREMGVGQLRKLLACALQAKQPAQQQMAYHASLEKMLELLRQFRANYSLEQLLQLILQHLSVLPGQRDQFILLAPRRVLSGNLVDTLSEDIFMGLGRFQISYPEFMQQAGSATRRALWQVFETAKSVQTENLLLLPVQDEKGMVSGVVGLQQPEGAAALDSPLLNIYVELVSSALHNNFLHLILHSKNDQLATAYHQLEESYLQTIGFLRYLVDAKDIYTRGHSDRVAYFALKLAQKISPDQEFCERVRVAGLLHDLGKIGVSDRILCKKEQLTEQEMAEIHKHPVLGAVILARVTMYSSLGPIVCAHHERFDGQGYPYQLAAADIPLEARIIAVADAFDAMLSNRHYRTSLSLEEAIQELVKGKDRQFDGELVDIFLSILEHYGSMQEELLWTTESAVPWPAYS